jgi:hypothetical protein
LGRGEGAGPTCLLFDFLSDPRSASGKVLSVDRLPAGHTAASGFVSVLFSAQVIDLAALNCITAHSQQRPQIVVG